MSPEGHDGDAFFERSALLRLGRLRGAALASAAGMLCAVIAIARCERPGWLWLIGILVNAYPFILLLLGVSVQLGITRQM